MEITCITYYGPNNWSSSIKYMTSPTPVLHIPRIGDIIKNSYGDKYKVTSVVWNLPDKSVDIYCKTIKYGSSKKKN